MSGRGMNDTSVFDTPPVLAGARVALSAEKTLMAEYTSLRELGGYGGTVSIGIDEGYLAGPNISSAVSMLIPTGGHGDNHEIPLIYLQDASKHGLPLTVCDGVEECIKAVRLQLRKGARLIKRYATESVFSLFDDPQQRQFSDEELKAVIEEAARAKLKRVVAEHCHRKEDMMAALKVEVKPI